MDDRDPIPISALATSCANRRLTFDGRQAHYGWDRKMESLLELVAGRLRERAALA